MPHPSVLSSQERVIAPIGASYSQPTLLGSVHQPAPLVHHSILFTLIDPRPKMALAVLTQPPPRTTAQVAASTNSCVVSHFSVFSAPNCVLQATGRQNSSTRILPIHSLACCLKDNRFPSHLPQVMVFSVIFDQSQFYTQRTQNQTGCFPLQPPC